jgi:predicted permease
MDIAGLRVQGSNLMTGWAQDFRLAMRQLRRNPGFALAVVLTLALGIGVNAAVFGLVNGFLLRPLPYPQADRLGVLLLHQEWPLNGGTGFSDSDNHDRNAWTWIRDNVPAVRAAAYGWAATGVNLQAVAAGGVVRFVREMRVSAHYFEVLGVPLFLGRDFRDEEDLRGGPPAAILSFQLWQSVFHSDPQVLGTTIRLKGEPYTVVGVLPPNLETPRLADLWVPLQPASAAECEGPNCGIILRLMPGSSWVEANTQLSGLRTPDFIETKFKGRAWFFASAMQKEVGRRTRTPLFVLMLAVSFIMLIGCANLAGLSLVRVARRSSEIATRLSLGATRWKILRQLWVESLLLAIVGAGAGLALTAAALKLLNSFLPEQFIPLGGMKIDIRVLAFTAAAAFLSSLLFGALPALQTRRVTLRSATVGGSHSIVPGKGRLKQFLTAGEVALSIVLLAGAGLLIHTLVYLETLPPGFDPTNVIAARLSLDDARYHEATAFHHLLQQSVSALKQIPGVEDAAVGLSVPYERGLDWPVKILDGEHAGEDSESSAAYVTPGYFTTLRIPVLVGRGFETTDTSTSEYVAVINVEFARKYFGRSSPIGHNIQCSGKTYRVVGMVANVAKKPGEEGNEPMGTERVYYIPADQASQEMVNLAHIWFQPSLIVRMKQPIDGITGLMQKALAKADPNLPFSGFYSMNDILAENLKLQRAEVLLLGGLAGLALVLSAVGIYGLVSNLVVQRTREIGLRLALGAQLRQVMLHVAGSGMVATGSGILVGAILASFAVRVLKSQLYGVALYDPLTLIAVPLLLAVVAIVASGVPTLRVAQIDPAETLRAE